MSTALRVTQHATVVQRCTLELLGWGAPVGHQEMLLDATRAARVSVPAGAACSVRVKCFCF